MDKTDAVSAVISETSPRNSTEILPESTPPEMSGQGGQDFVAAQPLGENEEDDDDSALGEDFASSTASLTSTILEYRKFQGRTFNSDKYETEYFAPNDERQKESIDISRYLTSHRNRDCDFADQYPNAEVIGTDLSPIQPDWIPPNVRFELEDATTNWTWSNGTFDFVHMRYLIGAIADWGALFKEAFRCCKPGGFVESVEVNPTFLSDNETASNVMAVQTFCEIEGDAELLAAAGFVDLQVTDFKVPVGGWAKDSKLRQVGQFLRATIENDLEATGVLPAELFHLIYWTVRTSALSIWVKTQNSTYYSTQNQHAFLKEFFLSSLSSGNRFQSSFDTNPVQYIRPSRTRLASMSETLETQLAQPYPGPPLPSSSHIRLVHLLPGTDTAVCCELITVPINAAPKYEALSYTWGDASSTEKIDMTTQGSKTPQQFSVTSNCFSALKRLRYKDKLRVLWIDALAIDQSNLDERNHQVSLMSKIYSQAAGVIVYLGKSADDSDLAIEFIMECYDPSPDNTSLSFPRSDTLMDALRNFFLRPWFTRVWVIQEVFLSSEKTIYCGEKEIPWPAMENFKHYLVNTRLQFRLPYVVSKASKYLAVEDAQIFMFYALLDSRHCKATDPRDKIYSLLPILQSHNKPLDLIPRYQDTPARIYTDCALSILPSCGWSLLSAVQGNLRTENLPSWVPDWNVQPQRHVIESDAIMGMEEFWEEMLPQAVPDKPQVVMRRPGERERPALHGHGYTCGKISKLGSTYIAGQTPFPAKEWYSLVNRIDLSTRPGTDSAGVKFPHRAEFFFRFLRLARYLYDSSMKEEEEEDAVDDFTKPDFIIGGSRESYQEYRFGSKWEDRIRKLALERRDGLSFAAVLCY
ncbi:hypothetical protein FACUT_7392 [Fusarium acutatum]|uniref:Heterokaryon incompatibility domain-containing protein n=1 Tax=Fusarium acutatum TaxID=78861 RepID=A0A8H4NEY0_9HYPO|nr:hypothetical protein FACUT_7392 [Fusarium acutatum]